MPGKCRGMQGNARGTYGSGCKVLGDCMGMPGEREYVQSARGMHGNAGKCMGMQAECKGVGVMCQGNAGE